MVTGSINWIFHGILIMDWCKVIEIFELGSSLSDNEYTEREISKMLSALCDSNKVHIQQRHTDKIVTIFIYPTLPNLCKADILRDPRLINCQLTTKKVYLKIGILWAYQSHLQIPIHEWRRKLEIAKWIRQYRK